MTDFKNAEQQRKIYLKNPGTCSHICKARPNWDGCDYCDVYGGGLCWNQRGGRYCCYCEIKK